MTYFLSMEHRSYFLDVCFKQAVLTLSALRRYLTGSNTNLFTWQHLEPYPRNVRATPYPIPNGTTIVTTNPYQAPPFTETLDPQKLTQQRPMAPAF